MESPLQDTTMEDQPVTAAALLDNIDDLFGEAADALPQDDLGVVSLPSLPPGPELLMRCAELQNHGCCTKLAWSTTGSIADVSDDGKKIDFRAMVRNDKSGIWNLSEKSKFPILAPPDTTWQHIQFSGIGIDLAAVDSAGGVHVHTLLGALGKMPEAQSKMESPDAGVANMDTVVGLYWLPVFPTDFKVPWISPSNKIEGRWLTTMAHRDPQEPKIHHAADSRQALLHVSRLSRLTLVYQNEAVWYSTSTDLESMDSDKETLTHASMCEDKDHVLLVTHDTNRRLRLYEISITWNPTQHQRPGGAAATLVSPSLQIMHLATVEDVGSFQADFLHLTQLRLLPTVPVATALTIQSYPTIVATFVHASSPSLQSHAHTDSFTVIARWNIETISPTIHSAFTKSKNNSASAIGGSATILQRQLDIVTPKIILTIEPQHYNAIIGFAASDGTIELRERSSMSIIEASFDTTTASSLPQCGFDQLALITEHATHVASSPDGCTMVYVKADKTRSSKTMAFRYSWQPVDDDLGDSIGLIEAAVICLARQYALLCCRSAANDEVLSLFPFTLDTDMRVLFIRENLRMTSRGLDIATIEPSRQHIIVIKEPLLARIMSASYILGVKPGTTNDQNAMSRAATAFLNMRSVCAALVQMLSLREMARPEFLHSLRGLVRWGADLLVHIIDNLVSIQRSHFLPANTPKQAVEQFIQQREDPTIHLLLCAFTRVFLRYFATLIPKYMLMTQKIVSFSRSVQERQQLAETLQYCASLPFKCAHLEALIGELDAAVRTAYTQGNLSANRRTDIEASLLCGTHHIPDELTTPLQVLFDSALPKFIQTIDQSKLYFWDTEWLGLSGEASVKLSRQYDAIRKLPLTSDMKIRVCRRCGSRMEDVAPDRARELPLWLAHAQRYCVCTTYWVLE